jgi:hypothetical protein
MMMQYLGWGIGHRNPPDFAHEANTLIASSHNRELEQYEIPADVEMSQTDPIADQEWEDEVDNGDRTSGAESDLGGSDLDREGVDNEVAATYDY